MAKKNKFIRVTAILLVVLIAFALLTEGFGFKNRGINYRNHVDDQPGTVYVAYRKGNIKIFTKPDDNIESVRKKFELKDTVQILPSSLKDTYKFVLIKFPDKSEKWVNLNDLNYSFYPIGRNREAVFMRLFDIIEGSILKMIIVTCVALLISFLLFRFYPKMNLLFTVNSQKAITKSQNPWFLYVAFGVGVILGYLFFFYRGSSVELLVNGDFLIPRFGLENTLLFVSFWGYIATVIVLAVKSIKEYGKKTGIWRTLFFLVVMIIDTLVVFCFVSGFIYILILIIFLSFFAGGSNNKNQKIISEEKPKICSVCGGQFGSHAMKCPNSHWSGRTMSAAEFNNMNYSERNSY